MEDCPDVLRVRVLVTKNRAMLIVRSTVAYVVTYLMLMVPTYILPYFGSNSTMVNAFSAAMGMGPTPQWWAHAWCLVMLAVLGWLRGGVIGKAFLPALPAVAALFDMTPGLSMVPLMPTLLHLAALYFGAQATATADEIVVQAASAAGLAQMRNAKVVVGLMTLLAVGGSILFASTPGSLASPLKKPAEKTPVVALPVSTPTRAMPAENPVVMEKVAVEPVVDRSPPPKPKVKRIANSDHPPRTPPAAATKPEVRYIRLND